MSVTRIGEFQAKESSVGDLKEFLISIMPMIKSSEGCESVRLYQSHEASSRFVMIEVWDDVESHQASVQNIPPEKLGKIRPATVGQAARISGVSSPSEWVVWRWRSIIAAVDARAWRESGRDASSG